MSSSFFLLEAILKSWLFVSLTLVNCYSFITVGRHPFTRKGASVDILCPSLMVTALALVVEPSARGKTPVHRELIPLGVLHVQHLWKSSGLISGRLCLSSTVHGANVQSFGTCTNSCSSTSSSSYIFSTTTSHCIYYCV